MELQPLMVPGEPHLGNLEGNTILLAQLLQLCHDALRHARYALRIQAVHHALHQVDLQPHPHEAIDS